MTNFTENMCSILEVDSVQFDQYLEAFDCWDSLTQLSIIAMAQQDYKVTLKNSDLDGLTIGELQKMIIMRMG